MEAKLFQDWDGEGDIGVCELSFYVFFFVSLASKIEVDYARDKTELEDAASQTVNNIFPQHKTETLAFAEFKNH